MTDGAFTQLGKLRNVKARVIEAVDAAALETAINTFISASGEGALVSMQFTDSSVGLAVLILYSE